MTVLRAFVPAPRPYRDLGLEWRRCSGFKHVDRTAFERVMMLCELSGHSDLQKAVMREAHLHLILLDLPAGAYPNHDQVLIDLVRKEISESPLLPTTKTYRALKAFVNLSAAVAGGSILAGRPSWATTAPAITAAFIAYMVLKKPWSALLARAGDRRAR